MSLKNKMKKIIVIFLSALFVFGCTQKKPPNKETAEKYFTARNSVEFKEIQDLISDSLTVIEGDYKMLYSQDSYYEVFKWDSVFQTSYEIVELKEIDEQIIVSISLSSIRNKFLKNDLMTCQFKLSFESGRISKIESLDCKDANWEVWQKRVNILADWIEDNHPELHGFIHDMTMKGAKNYLKAINLYELNENDL
ncbi:MAG: hypothetical protein ACJA1A_001137 [Saprospiraceae bacterium]|jgi:hypothetical protein